MSRQAKGPHLYLRKRKGRVAVWHIRDGRQIEVSTGCGPDDCRGAEERLATYIAQKWKPSTSERDPARVPVAEVLMLYARESAPQHADPSKVGFMMQRLLSYWADKTLADVRGSTCRAYAEQRAAMIWQGRTVSTGTARRELGMLQAAINYWHKESPLDTVPVVTMPPPSPARQRFLTRGEAAGLLWAARKQPHIARFILIGLYTGTRHSAILSLRWLPSPDCGWLDLDKTVIHRRGFGQRETKKRTSPARIPDRLMAHLRRWHRFDTAGGVVAVVHWKGMQIAETKRGWSRVVEAAGLGPEVTPHVLRHTCATWALHSGMSAWDVAALLATSVQTIEATYGHHSPEFQKAAKGAFAGHIAGRR